METELTKTYQLRTTDFDRYGRMKPSAVLDVCQDLAGLQAEGMGIGAADMEARGVFWAVIRMKYEVLAHPQMHDDVVARTWPHDPSRFSFLRDYTLKSTSGDLLVKATSEWVMMDARTRKFASVKDNYDGPMDFSPDRAFEKKPRRVRDFAIDGLAPYRVVPAYSDVDVNGHVNNTRYATYVMNALDPGEQGEIRTFQIDYRLEVQEGEPLDIYYVRDGATITAKGVAAEGDHAGATMFLCKIEAAL